MRYEIYDKSRAREGDSAKGYGWRKLDGERVVFDSPKTFPTQAAAERNMLRHLDPRRKTPPEEPPHFNLRTCDGRSLRFRLIADQDTGHCRWAVCHAIQQTNSGWEWGAVDHESKAYVSESFESEKEARRDAARTLKHGGLDDRIARECRDARETKNGVKGERMEVLVAPLRAASDPTTPATSA